VEKLTGDCGPEGRLKGIPDKLPVCGPVGRNVRHGRPCATLTYEWADVFCSLW
jgi:hypothetical protein